MITIRKFAALCGCSVDTLRYYDRIDLLKPAMINNETGYRYYRSDQVDDYNKIRNLQFAGFSIEEIKKIWNYSDLEMSELIEKKMLELCIKLQFMKNLSDFYRKRGQIYND